MNKTKTILLTALLASSVTTVQADGFFSKMFGSAAKGGTNFKSLISHVPANTPYMFGNEKAFPEDVMSFHLDRSQKAMKMFTEMEKNNKDKKELKGAEKFMSALFEDFSNKLAEKKLEETGISLQTTALIYGLDVTPVARVSYNDKAKLMATIKRAEEKSGYNVEFTKCGEFDCIVEDADADKSIAFVILNDHFAASFFTKSDKDKIINHLIGKTNPKESYGIKKWDAFLKENNYKGYGEGFVDLKGLSSTIKPMIMKDLAKKVPAEELEGCMAVAQAHIDNVPAIVMGTKNLDVKHMDYEMYFKTSSDVSTTLKGIANKTNIAKRAADPILDFGINVDFAKLRDAITQYSNFLIKSGETNKCKSIDAREIRKGMGGMMMAMNMGLTQFKSIYASVTDVELDDKMSPKKVDAYISLGTDDPSGLLGMVSMMSPKLMGFKVPADGSVVKLPDGAIPSKGQKVPDIYLSRSDKALNIMVGNNKPSLKDYKNSTPEISSFSMDGKRYYEVFSKIMKALPNPRGASKDDEKAVSEMMTTMGEMMGVYTQEVIADDRGLVINYHVKY